MIPGKERSDRARVTVRQPTRPEQARKQNMASMFSPQHRANKNIRIKKIPNKISGVHCGHSKVQWCYPGPITAANQNGQVEGKPGDERNNGSPDGEVDDGYDEGLGRPRSSRIRQEEQEKSSKQP